MQFLSPTTATELLIPIKLTISQNLAGILLVFATMFAISFVVAWINVAKEGKMARENNHRGFNGRYLP